jgi:4-hydroxyphenylpyruvate dioxygenase
MTVLSERSSASHVRQTVHVRDIDHVELYVANVVQAVHFFSAALSLQPVLYSGPETGAQDRVSYLLQHGGIRLLLSSPLRADGEIAVSLREHGDTVKDIALRVDNAKAAFEAAIGCRSGKGLTEDREWALC